MRTTLTIDPDVAKLLDDAVHRQRKSFKHVVNEALRRGLSQTTPASHRPPYSVRAHQSGFVAGIDAASLNRLNDELDTEHHVALMRTDVERQR